MTKEYQVTLICATGQYKPVSAIVKGEDARLIEIGRKAFKQEMITKGIQKICNKRYWSKRDLTNNHYTKVKIREYNKEKIEQENKERYERIKKERGWV